jgi:hypothetical protein
VPRIGCEAATLGWFELRPPLRDYSSVHPTDIANRSPPEIWAAGCAGTGLRTVNTALMLPEVVQEK